MKTTATADITAKVVGTFTSTCLARLASSTKFGSLLAKLPLEV